MSTRTKILITIALAVLCSWLFGCQQEHLVPVPAPAYGTIDAAYLESLYAVYNAGYFQNKLPQAVVINMYESNPEFMASTMKKNGVFVIQFNEHYVVAVRTAELTMLHEMCHVKTWDSDTVRNIDGSITQSDHGKMWRACMLQLDMQGANRQVLIDNYYGR